MPSFTDLICPYLKEQSDTIALFRSCLTEQTVRRHKELIQPGLVCGSIGFIKRGACYKYQPKKGHNQVAQFYTAGDLVADFQSFLFQRPTEFSIRVQEEVELEVLSFDSLQDLYNREPRVERIGRLLVERKLDELVDQFWSVRQESPQLRYQKLVEQRPLVIQHFPQFLIASYLGVTPVGLSKIRRRLANGTF